MELQGTILFINSEVTPSEKSPNFKTREFGLDISFEDNGEVREKYAKFQTKNNNNAKLDGLVIGQKVKVTFSFEGNKFIATKVPANPNPLNPENLNVITNLNAWKFEVWDETQNKFVMHVPPVAGDATSTTTETPPPNTNGVKPDVIPEGYEWDEEKKELKVKLPF